MARCKPGDLAIFVASAGDGSANSDIRSGMIVTVLSAAYIGEHYRGVDKKNLVIRLDQIKRSPCWRCRVAHPVKWVSLDGQFAQFLEVPLSDAHLRPLRDSDGEDETFQWAGKPQEEVKPKGVVK